MTVLPEHHKHTAPIHPLSPQPPTKRRSHHLIRKVTRSFDEDEDSPSFHPFTEMRPFEETPLFTAGLLADIQYAPIPDGHSFSGIPRYYRHALATARIAAEHFQRERAELVINLGDIIDGKCHSEPGGGHAAMEDVLTALSAYRGPVIHTYGNHELYSLNREQIGQKLNIPFTSEGPSGDLVGYHTYSPRPGIRFVVLDTYDIAIMQRCPNTSSKRKEAERILARNNPNFPQNENSPQNLEGLQRRFVAFNGGVGSNQIQWLRETLYTSRQNGEKVIVLSHQPILPGSTSDVCLVWNYDDILQILREYRGTVVASLAGHAHKGGYKRDDMSGIHFRVVEAVLESNHPDKTYGFLDVYDDRLEIRGSGKCEMAVYEFEGVHPIKVES